MKSPHCQMNQNNLARVFGPTVVGHGMSEPSPTTIMRDTNTQPKVSSLRFADQSLFEGQNPADLKLEFAGFKLLARFKCSLRSRIPRVSDRSHAHV